MNDKTTETIFWSSSQQVDKKVWDYGWNTEVDFDKYQRLKNASVI